MHLWLCLSSPWGGGHTEAGRQGRQRAPEGEVGRGAEAKRLGPSAWVLGLDLGGWGLLWPAVRGADGSLADGEARARAATLTLLQLDVAAAFELRDPAVVDGPWGLWNGPGSGSAPLTGGGDPSRPPPGPSARQTGPGLQV